MSQKVETPAKMTRPIDLKEHDLTTKVVTAGDIYAGTLDGRTSIDADTALAALIAAQKNLSHYMLSMCKGDRPGGWPKMNWQDYLNTSLTGGHGRTMSLDDQMGYWDGVISSLQSQLEEEFKASVKDGSH